MAITIHALFDWSRIEGNWIIETDVDLQEQAPKKMSHLWNTIVLLKALTPSIW